MQDAANDDNIPPQLNESIQSRSATVIPNNYTAGSVSAILEGSNNNAEEGGHHHGVMT